jgi:hypothetical protein
VRLRTPLGAWPVSSHAVTLAHPVSGHPHVAFPVVLTALVAALLVFVVALAVPARTARTSAPAGTITPSPAASWEGPLSTAQLVTRTFTVVLLCLTILAGRFGADDQLENLAPALVVGAGWPLLVLASVAAGPVWRWVDPWDSLARALSGAADRARDAAAVGTTATVLPAAIVLLPVMWFVSANPYSLDPRAVGAALALYTIVTVTGCVAFGRRRWLAHVEPLGSLLTWMALLPRGRLWDWDPPRGTEILLGVATGGLLFGAVRQSGLWTGVNRLPSAPAYNTLGLLCLCAAFAGLFVLMGRIERMAGGRPAIARGAVPAVAGIMLAVALERNRLSTSLQLLPGQLGDPFGLGWDLLGPAVDGLDPAPLGAAGLLVLQLDVLVAAHLAGAVAVALRLRDTARLPAAVLLLHLMALSVFAVALH